VNACPTKKPCNLAGFLLYAPRETRTPNRLFRRQVLCPIELWVQLGGNYNLSEDVTRVRKDQLALTENPTIFQAGRCSYVLSVIIIRVALSYRMENDGKITIGMLPGFLMGDKVLTP
jgi:hypothetical protein